MKAALAILCLTAGCGTVPVAVAPHLGESNAPVVVVKAPIQIGPTTQPAVTVTSPIQIGPTTRPLIDNQTVVNLPDIDKPLYVVGGVLGALLLAHTLLSHLSRQRAARRRST